MCFILLNASLHSTDFDVQDDCLLKQPSPTSQNVFMLHSSLQIETTEAQKTIKWSIISFNGARIKVHLLQKDVTMLKLKG